MIINPEIFPSIAIEHNLVQPIDVTNARIYSGMTDGFPSIWVEKSGKVVLYFLYKSQSDLDLEKVKLEKVMYETK